MRAMARMPFVVVALALAAAVAGCEDAAAEHEVDGARKPNIVLVLADDLDWSLLRFMPEVQRLRRDGATLERFYVADSLCCTSRASMFAGRYPHNTHVRSNVPPTGGYPYELVNLARSMSPRARERRHRRLALLRACIGADCRRADRLR